MTIAEVFTIGIAFTALIISVFSLVLQYLVEGAIVDVLNANDIQRIFVRPFDRLPSDIQDKFAPLRDDMLRWNGCILFTMVLGNAGDRAGIANITDIRVVTDENSLFADAKPDYEKYTFIPAYEIVEKNILLKNVPKPLEIDKTKAVKSLQIDVTLELGSYHPRKGKYLHKGTIQKTLKIEIMNDYGKPWSPL